MTHSIRESLCSYDRVNYDAAFYLGRVTGNTVSSRTSDDLRRKLESMDFDSYQAIRSIPTVWPEYKGKTPKSEPCDARWSKARADMFRRLEHHTTQAWANMARWALDATCLINPGCADEVCFAMLAIVRDAWEHGAITRAQCSILEGYITGGYRVATKLPYSWAFYVNGARYATYDAAKQACAAMLGTSEHDVTLPKVWDRYVDARREWANRPGYAQNTPINGYTLPSGKREPAQWWTPVRDAKCSVDRERNTAVWHMCCAFAGFGRNHIPAYRASQMKAQLGASV